MFPDTDKLTDIDKEYLIKRFTALNFSNIRTFEISKILTHGFLRWLSAENLIPPEKVQELKEITLDDVAWSEDNYAYYYRSFDELWETMMQAPRTQENELDDVFTAIMLLWLGISLEALCELEKADVDDVHNIVLHPRTRQQIAVPPRGMEIIRRYRDAWRCPRSSSGKVYCQTQYLMRTPKLAKVRAKDIRNLLNILTLDRMKDAPKRFVAGKLYLSGLYRRIYEYEQEHGEVSADDLESAREVFEFPLLTNRDRCRLLREKIKNYQQYKKIMFA